MFLSKSVLRLETQGADVGGKIPQSTFGGLRGCPHTNVEASRSFLCFTSESPPPKLVTRGLHKYPRILREKLTDHFAVLEESQSLFLSYFVII